MHCFTYMNAALLKKLHTFTAYVQDCRKSCTLLPYLCRIVEKVAHFNWILPGMKKKLHSYTKFVQHFRKSCTRSLISATKFRKKRRTKICTCKCVLCRYILAHFGYVCKYFKISAHFYHLYAKIKLHMIKKV